MKSSSQILIFLSIAVILAMLSSMVAPTPTAQAQGTPRPTPANQSPGDDGDRDDDDDDDDGRGGGRQAGPSYGEIVGGANVSGIVYNYTTGNPQSGVTVRIEGHNWQAETVTDLNGMYQFGGLSFGEGQLSLVLPLGATQAAPNWPVPLTAGDHKVNLGYYVGDFNPLPVRVSAEIQEKILRVRINNQAVGGASNARLEIQLPMSLEAAPTMHSSRGVVEYGLHTPQVYVARLAGGEQVEVVIPLHRSTMGDRSARAYQYVPTSPQRQRAERVVIVNQTPGQQSEIIQLKFTYDQQLTPQIIRLDPFAPSPVNEFQNLKGPLPQAEPASLIEPPTPPTSSPENTNTTSESPASEITTEGAAMAEEAVDTSSEPVTAEPAAAFVPAAGGVIRHPSTAQFFISLVVGVGLLMSGWWSLRIPRTEQQYLDK